MSITYTFINHESTGRASAVMCHLAEATNLNASGLARAMGVAVSTVTRTLRGEVCPRYDDMLHYAYCLGFAVEDNKVVRLAHLKGYRSPKEIGDFINTELADGLNAERLDVLLRYLPKAVLDWQELADEDQDRLMLQPAKVTDVRFQALVEGAVQYFAHQNRWKEAPSWTERTRLKEPFVPRAAVREVGSRWYARMQKRLCPEFLNKNVLFTCDEMKVL
ncbi:MAG: hypothetical protein LBK67_06035 [Coriobacteriales bacterium]|nr:hypothetical protein [Coriobacteriales bacterium]